MAITLTYTFVPHTTAASAEVNANFSLLATRALDKTGDTMTGNLTFTDATYDIGASGATRPRHGYFSGNLVIGGALTVGTSLTIGSGTVALVGTDGKINGPLSSTIIDDLSGANLTTLNATNLSSGTVATARLGSGSASATTFLRGDSSWATGAAGAMVYIGGGSGTNATAAATTVATVSVSGLTALDSLVVVVHDGCTGGTNVTRPYIYNETNGADIQVLGYPLDIAAGEQTNNYFKISRTQTSNTIIMTVGVGALTGAGGGANAAATTVALTAGWTNAWTIGLRHKGIVGGGTYHYNWSVYRLAGQ